MTAYASQYSLGGSSSSLDPELGVYKNKKKFHVKVDSIQCMLEMEENHGNNKRP